MNENYYKLPDGRYVSYYELANNPKYSTRQEDTWYEVPTSYVLKDYDAGGAWTYNGKDLNRLQIIQQFGKAPTVLVNRKPTGVTSKPVLEYTWTNSNGKAYSKDVSKLLEQLYLNKLKGIQSNIPAFYTDENTPINEDNPVQLGEVVVTAKLTEEGKRKAEERKQLELEEERAAEELAYQNWLNNPKGEIPDQPILSSWGTGTGFDVYSGKNRNEKFYNILHSPEMRKWDYFGLSLLAPNAMFALPALTAGASYLAPGTVGGNILGHMAGSTALAKTLENGSRYLFGQSAGDWLVNKAVNNWGVNRAAADIFLRPEWWINPTGKITGNLTKWLGVKDPYKAFSYVGVNNSIPMSSIHYPTNSQNIMHRAGNFVKNSLSGHYDFDKPFMLNMFEKASDAHGELWKLKRQLKDDYSEMVGDPKIYSRRGDLGDPLLPTGSIYDDSGVNDLDYFRYRTKDLGISLDDATVKLYFPLKDVWNYTEGNSLYKRIKNTAKYYPLLNLEPGFFIHKYDALSDLPNLQTDLIKYRKYMDMPELATLAHEKVHLLDSKFSRNRLPGATLELSNPETYGAFNFSNLSEDMKDYFRHDEYTELAARGSLLKNAFPYQKLTGEHLKYLAKHYKFDNNMMEFFNSIQDWDKAAEWINIMCYKKGGKLIKRFK